jgi:hypothetical protein
MWKFDAEVPIVDKSDVELLPGQLIRVYWTACRDKMNVPVAIDVREETTHHAFEREGAL